MMWGRKWIALWGLVLALVLAVKAPNKTLSYWTAIALAAFWSYRYTEGR